jgi:(p)ppGpp synthase/HD superfamily hydrolase
MQLQSLTKAVLFATSAHEGQTRKYTGEPYITHPMAVAKIVSDFGGDLNQIIAAYLHDTIEDVLRVTHKIVEGSFGDDVGMLVHGMTKDEYPKGTSRRDKKALEATRLAGTDARVQFIKCADIIHNSGTIIQHNIEFADIYLTENLKAVEGMVSANENIRDYAIAVLHAELAKLKVLRGN